MQNKEFMKCWNRKYATMVGSVLSPSDFWFKICYHGVFLSIGRNSISLSYLMTYLVTY